MIDGFFDVLADGRFGVLADSRFERYFELLVRRNSEFNLTAITSREEVWVKHFADSLAALPFVKSGAAVLDVGSGAGFPGLPLALAREDIRVTLVESIAKKAGFLREACGVLGLGGVGVLNSRTGDLNGRSEILNNRSEDLNGRVDDLNCLADDLNCRVEDLNCRAEVLNCRAEDLPRGKFFDCGVARAVAKTATLCEYILPFIRVGGVMIAYKAKDAEQEAAEAERAIGILGGKLEEIRRVELGDNERNLIVIRKIKETPAKYPRGGNKAKIAPL